MPNDFCPTCHTPLSPDQVSRMEENKECICAVGFGSSFNTQCPKHGITGTVRVVVNPVVTVTSGGSRE